MKFLLAAAFLALVAYTQAGYLGGYRGGFGAPHAGFVVGHAAVAPAFGGRGIPVGRAASHVTHINHGGVGVGLGGFGLGHGVGGFGVGHGVGGFGLGYGVGGFGLGHGVGGLGLGHGVGGFGFGHGLGGFGYGLGVGGIGYGHGLGVAKFH
ncbi:glycine-rich protein-like [Limulus polyphemus]|uniref:Glycine-rich protein-like n=1 Tax=Limulus polyphemus TaxID=6850 RepID=A0ABM1BBR8_LIMPO|nr:glycine-rich protein-like [Limulus polyphemus]